MKRKGKWLILCLAVIVVGFIEVTREGLFSPYFTLNIKLVKMKDTMTSDTKRKNSSAITRDKSILLKEIPVVCRFSCTSADKTCSSILATIKCPNHIKLNTFVKPGTSNPTNFVISGKINVAKDPFCYQPLVKSSTTSYQLDANLDYTIQTPLLEDAKIHKINDIIHMDGVVTKHWVGVASCREYRNSLAEQMVEQVTEALQKEIQTLEKESKEYRENKK